MYSLTRAGLVIRDADQANIPEDPANADFQAYQRWLAEGNTATPAPASDAATIVNQKVAAGCQIVSAGTPALSATYGIGMQDEINLTGLQSAINAGVPFLGYIRDVNRVKKPMTAAQFTVVAAVILQYIAAIDDFAAGQGNLPPQPVAIA